MRNWVEDFDPTEDDILFLATGPSAPPGLGESAEEVGGAYITISQQASEREHLQAPAQASGSTVASPPTQASPSSP